jgi:hypothetical protein
VSGVTKASYGFFHSLSPAFQRALDLLRGEPSLRSMGPDRGFFCLGAGLPAAVAGADQPLAPIEDRDVTAIRWASCAY